MEGCEIKEFDFDNRRKQEGARVEIL